MIRTNHLRGLLMLGFGLLLLMVGAQFESTPASAEAPQPGTADVAPPAPIPTAAAIAPTTPNGSATDKDTVDDPVNIGHYIVGPYEFFAEERTRKQQLNDVERSRIFVMPNVVLLPWETLLFRDGIEINEFDKIVDQEESASESSPQPPVGSGADLEAKTASLRTRRSRAGVGQTTCAVPEPQLVRGVAQPKDSPAKTRARYTARIAFKLTTDEVSPPAKEVMFNQLWNKDYGDIVAKLTENNVYFWRRAAISRPAAAPENPSTALDSVSSDVISRPNLVVSVDNYRFEVTPPSSVVVRINCNGQERGAAGFPNGAVMSTASTVGVECADLDAATARMIFNGHFSVEADMRVPLSKMQFAIARYDLRRFNSILAQQFARRDTTVKEEDHGFLFWHNVERSVQTLVDTRSTLNATSSQDASAFVSLRDVSDSAIREAALNFVIPRHPATNDDVRKIIKDHVEAAAQADAAGNKQAAEAHRSYADYLTKLLAGKVDNSAADRALDALANMINSAGSDDSAAAAGASSGNPYVAIAMFVIKGITWKGSSNSDTFQMASMRSATWSDSDSREFNAVLANQISASYTVTQSDFPQLQAYVAKRRELGPNTPASKIIDALRQEAEEKAAQLYAKKP